MTEMMITIREEIDEAIKKGEQPKIRRVLALDFGRGWAIYFVIFLHGAIFNAFSGGSLGSDLGDVNPFLVIFMLPFIILGSWASIFAIVTGAASVFSTYNHVILKGRSKSSKLKSVLIRFVILIIINFIYVYFFMHPAENIMGEPTQSMITGSIHNLELFIPSGAVLFHSSAFIMIAFSDLVVTIVSLFLFNKGEEIKFKRNFIIFNSIMCIFLYTAPLLQSYFTPIAQDSYTNGNYILSMILTWLFGTKHCVFPFAGHGLCGASIALMLLHDKDSKNLKLYQKVLIFGNLTIFAISLIVTYFSGGELLTLSNPVQSFSYYILNFALQMIPTIWAFIKFDFNTIKGRESFSKKTLGLRRFGTISLTCFAIEQPIAALFALLSNTLYPEGLNNVLFVVLIFTPLYAYGWWKAVYIWDHQKNLKGSIEYMLASIGKSKKELKKCPDLLCLGENIYKPARLERDGITELLVE